MLRSGLLVWTNLKFRNVLLQDSCSNLEATATELKSEEQEQTCICVTTHLVTGTFLIAFNHGYICCHIWFQFQQQGAMQQVCSKQVYLGQSYAHFERAYSGQQASISGTKITAITQGQIYCATAYNPTPCSGMACTHEHSCLLLGK
jgi:hypothetical protein